MMLVYVDDGFVGVDVGGVAVGLGGGVPEGKQGAALVIDSADQAGEVGVEEGPVLGAVGAVREVAAGVASDVPGHGGTSWLVRWCQAWRAASRVV